MRDGVARTLRAAGFRPSSQGYRSPDGPEGFLLQQSPDGSIVIQHATVAEPAGGVPPQDRADQMLDRYARKLRGAGYDITRSGPASLTVRGPYPSPHPGQGATDHGDPEPDNRILANRAAIAANAAYRAGDLQRARQLTDQATALDPTRAEVWQRHRAEIDAKRILHEAVAARGEGDQARARELIEDARLNPRMTSLWDQDLPELPGRREPAARDQAAPSDTLGRPTVEPARARDCGNAAEPRWPERPVLHQSHDARFHGRGPQAAESGDTVGTKGASRASIDRQPRPEPEPETQLDRFQEAAPRAAPPDWRDAVTERERREWQPKVVAAEPELAATAEHSGAEIRS